MAMTPEKSKMTPSQKAMLFAQATRQNLQVMPQQAYADNSTISFDVPKVRLLSRVYVRIKGTYNLVNAVPGNAVIGRFAPWSLVRQVRMQINNGFNPFQISGRGVYEYNRLNSGIEFDTSFILGNVASAGAGTVNTIDVLFDLSSILNDRDPVGLVMTQNQETVVSVGFDFGTLLSMFTLAGTTVTNVNITATPTIESYSIPASIEAIPDLSVLKLVTEQNFPIVSTGAPFLIKLPVGLTYRKIILNFEDVNGVAMTDDQIGQISIIFNQADIPYVVNAGLLREVNNREFRGKLQAGVVAFDFSYQGLANLGGARDYIDTERLTEFWIQSNPTILGNLQVVVETLARLAGV